MLILDIDREGFTRQRRPLAREAMRIRRSMSPGLWRPPPDSNDFRVRGRSPIVHRFHNLRRRDSPPVLIIQGVRGAGKSDLVLRLQFGFRRRWAWRVGREVDVLLKINASLATP